MSDELYRDLTAEERSALSNLLCGPSLTLSTPEATLLELTAAANVVDLVEAMLRARRVYLIATGAGR